MHLIITVYTDNSLLFRLMVVTLCKSTLVHSMIFWSKMTTFFPEGCKELSYLIPRAPVMILINSQIYWVGIYSISESYRLIGLDKSRLTFSRSNLAVIVSLTFSGRNNAVFSVKSTILTESYSAFSWNVAILSSSK